MNQSSFIELEENLAPQDFLNLDCLNEAQQEAVKTTEGPLLVLAGAGTGKTRVLTTRIAYILKNNLAFPSQILAVTFTNKAAKEMRARIDEMLGFNAQDLFLGTFHSICLRIIRRHSEHLNLKSDFTIIDPDDQIRLLKQIIAEHNLDDKKYPPKLAAAKINHWKDRAQTPDKVDDGDVLGEVYKTYQQRLNTLGVVDFGDLILHCITLFTTHPEVLSEYHNRLKYILVDEYQDTNIAQYLWLRLLAQGAHNICCVGDDDQSIYGWRGAEVGNILRFEKDFADAKTIRLEKNYRSTPHILASASKLISHNKDRLGKTLFSDHDEGEKVKIISLWDDKQEASYVGGEIEALQQIKKHPLEEIAILVRAGYQTRAFEEAFISMSIPYRIIGGFRFYERMEIRDAIAYIKIVCQPENDLALERIINLPKRGIGPGTLTEIRDHARSRNIPMIEAIRQKLEENSFKPKIGETLKIFLKNYDYWRELLAEEEHVDVVSKILEQSGYMDMWKSEKTLEAEGRVENLKELLNALEEFESLQQFLEHISLVMEGDEAADTEKVSIMTIHSAKGLEFETLFLPGWEEGLFPSQKSIDEKGQGGLEEERRLAHVGITRAKRNLTISFASNRFLYGKSISSIPSRFIDELPINDIEIINNAGPGYRSEQQFERKPSFSKFKKKEKPVSYNSSVFDVGERIFHQKFGYGKVLEITGKHIKVAFEKASVKTIMEEYLKKA